MLTRLLVLMLCAAHAHSPDHVLAAGASVENHVCEHGPSCSAPYTVTVDGYARLVGRVSAGASYLGEDLMMHGMDVFEWNSVQRILLTYSYFISTIYLL